MAQHPTGLTAAPREPLQPAGRSGSTAELVLVLDFGGQTAQLIARRIRDHNVLCQVVRHDLPAERIRELKPRGLILSGGPASVYEERAPQFDPEIFELNIPVLGICYGMHVACRALGSEVKPYRGPQDPT